MTSPTQTTGTDVARGRPANGLYPHISRTHLAEATGLHLSTVSNILHGKRKVGLESAVVMARVVGVTVEELSKALRRQQGKWERKNGKR